MSESSSASKNAALQAAVTRFDQMPVSVMGAPKYCNVVVFVKAAYFIPPSPIPEGKRPVFSTLVCDLNGMMIKLNCTQDIINKLCIAVRKFDFTTPLLIVNCYRTEIPDQFAMGCLDGIGHKNFQLTCDDTSNVATVLPGELPAVNCPARCGVSVRGDFPTSRSECVYSVVVALVTYAALEVNPRDASGQILKCVVIDSTGRKMVVTDWNHQKHPWASVPAANSPAAFYFFAPPVENARSRNYDNSSKLQNCQSLSFVSDHCIGATMKALWEAAMSYKETTPTPSQATSAQQAAPPINAINIDDDEIAELMRERGMKHRASFTA